MRAIQWDDSFIVGVERIDQHNKHLIDLVEKVCGSIFNESDKQKIGSEIRELSDYVTFHFACEEIWMRHSKYPSIAVHHRYHLQLMKELGHVYSYGVNASSSVYKNMLCLSLSIAEHIKCEDLKYGSYLSGIRQIQLMPRRYLK